MIVMSGPLPTARVARHFNIPAERLFDAWLDTSVIGQWMFGPNVRDEQIVSLSNDPRVGGKFSFVVRRQANELDHVGTYKEITRPYRLVFSWGVAVAGKSDGETLVAIDIKPHEKGSDLILTHELAPSWANFTEQAAQAWAKMLDALSKNVT